MANYDIKLFAHGVPKGQSIWGNPKAESLYIESFYGRQSSVSTQMLIEVMRMGNETSCYYTYLKTGNLQDMDGRPGGYFALTLKVNYYYADIHNIYNLLETAFNKYILGTILSSTGAGYRFRVSRLEEVASTLNGLEEELRHYLMQFSTNQDFVPLTGFKSNGQEACGTIHLLEASAKVVLEHVKRTGKISVSSLYPSAAESQLRSEIEKSAQQKISTIRQQAAAEVEKALREKEASLQASKDERLSSQRYKSLYEKSEQDLDKARRTLSEIKRSLESIRGIDGQDSVPGHGEANNRPQDMGVKTPLRRKSVLPLLNLLLTLLLVVFLIPRSCSNGGTKDKDAPNDMADTVTYESPGQENPNVEEESVPEEVATPTPGEEPLPDSGETGSEEVALEDLFEGAWIDIKGIGRSNPMRKGIAYKVTLQKGPSDLEGQGQWQSTDFTIKSNDSIVPKHTGECVISYMINGKVAKTRTIIVQK